MTETATSSGQTPAPGAALTAQRALLRRALEHRRAQFQKTAKADAAHVAGAAQEIAGRLGAAGPLAVARAFAEYQVDAAQRLALTLDALRQRGDVFQQHEAAGAPPVLIYDYEIVMDGKDLPRPCCYMLLRIAPPEGVTVHDWKRPYVIIDPRAGHGPGIGGFKPDSQVGVALKDGHPVYFVAFRPQPEPGQTLASVTHAEAAFLREVRRRHPEAPRPIVVGNCQGGWATAILSAMNPDLSGPIVLNGAPMSYWSGRLGQDPMRYKGGETLGMLPVLLLSDLHSGVFDGAHLVLNFEMQNPGRTWFRKYFDIYRDIDDGVEKFVEFEKWWGGFFLMNVDEIAWIVENLFVGNRLAKNEARLETGRPIDLKRIRAPIIVFASHGDNITPPQQALNWIVDTYADEREIEIRGQRILYMVHEQVGHLGIFVSSSVAKREHSQMASTLKTIEALPPGLYEMEIEDVVGEGHEKRFTVSFSKRRMSDILALDDGREEEAAFAAVSRLSEALVEAYDGGPRPIVRALAHPALTEASRKLHPLRAQRRMFASNTPLGAAIAPVAETARRHRKPPAADNPFIAAERLWADVVERQWNLVRDLQATATELGFLALYANPFVTRYGAPRAHRRTVKTSDELRTLPPVLSALDHLERGGLAEGVVRMLVLLADTRAEVRRDRLQRSSEILATRAPFAELGEETRGRMIHEQTLIAHFEREAGLAALPMLLRARQERETAMELVLEILGAVSEMSPSTLATLEEMRALLEMPPLTATLGAAE